VSTFWCFLHYTVAVGRVLILATRTRGERSVSACVNCMEVEKHSKKNGRGRDHTGDSRTASCTLVCSLCCESNCFSKQYDCC
jgi:hypothetical protein